MSICEYSFSDELLGLGKDAEVKLIEKDKKKYALKIFKNPNAIYNPIEVDILFRLKSENLLKGDDILEPGVCSLNSPGLVTPFIGLNTKDNLQFMTYKDKKKIMLDMAKGMRCIHNNKYLYLDCKLENTMLKKEKGEYKGVLIDFGLSSYTPKGIEKGILSLQRRIKGVYTPPECIKEYDEGFFYNNKSDIWTLAITYMLIITDNYHFIPSNIVKDVTYPDFTDLAEFYLTYFNEDCIEKYMTDMILPKIRHDEVKINKSDETKKLLGLLINMMRINEKKRFSIQDVMNSSFFKEENKADKCEKDVVKNISLADVEPEYFIGIYIIIDYLKEHFPREGINIFFLAIDLYLRCVYELTTEFVIFEYENAKILAKNCALIAFKYYNWSELKRFPEELTKKLYIGEFPKDEAILYKKLNGKIREERYFENAKSEKELIGVYNYFIRAKKSDAKIEFVINETMYTINSNILSYLNQDGAKFLEKMNLDQKNNIFNISIRDFFG